MVTTTINILNFTPYYSKSQVQLMFVSTILFSYDDNNKISSDGNHSGSNRWAVLL